ncbi:MAG: sigma 54-interacting transcriptional regulator, partial [Candidatus Adiutrix sp.]
MSDIPKLHQSMPREAGVVAQALTESLAESANRKNVLRVLAESLQPLCHFSWLTIRVCDQSEEMLADYSIAHKQLINPFAPVLPRSLTSVVADYIQDTRNNLIIPDCIEYFLDTASPPIFQHSVASVISFPLMLNNEIVAILLLGFEHKPDNLYKIASFLSWLCPTIAACLGVVLSLETIRGGRSDPPTDHVSLAEHAYKAGVDTAVIFRSQAMVEIIRQVNALTRLDVPVLLLGETGTGKSMIARYIHDHSLRSHGKFVRVNCPSLASSLFESEMFGHAKGSFTGATKNRIGRFELAHQGTLFLDEVAELSMDMQSKLLQVLDDMSFERVGESTPIMVDMRIVAATNVHIGQAISQGRLRGDLFHRISVYTIELPPLRSRPEDIAPLAMALSTRSSEHLNLPDLNYTPEVIDGLSSYYWPGNTRELSNLMTRLVIAQSVKGHLDKSMVAEAIAQSESYFLAESGQGEPILPVTSQPSQSPQDLGAPAGAGSPLAVMEREHILRALKAADGVVAGPRGAASALGLP